MKNNIQKYRLTILLFLISLICSASFHLIGTDINENGYIREPFALIPIGWIFFFASIISLAWLKMKKQITFASKR